MEYTIFSEIGLVIGVAVVIGLLGLLLRQPLVVSFIVVGVLVGPVGLNLVTDQEQMELLGQIGIALLLFVVGLRLDLHMVRTVGAVALFSGMTQIGFIALAGFLLARALGLAPTPALVLAVALLSSSTIIIVKLLSDKGEIDALHGRMTVAISVLQDIMVVLAMIGLSALAGARAEENRMLFQMLLVIGRGLLFLGGVAVIMLVVLPRLLPLIARSSELLLLFSVAWAVALAALADGIGLSKEVGAFVAGIALAWTPYRESISARMVPLRDFLLLFFFISLGSRLQLGLLGGQLLNGILLTLFLLFGKALTVMVVIGLMGYRKRTGFLTGIAMTPLSEFGLIFAGMALGQGHITEETVGLITVIAILSIGISTYMILYSAELYSRLSRALRIFERRVPFREAEGAALAGLPHADVILFGLGTYGGTIARYLLEHGKRVVGVDFDPQVVAESPVEGLVAVYGDAEDPELLDHLPLHGARWVLSALPHRDSNLTLLRAVRERGFGGKVVLSARSHSDARLLRQAGADLVLSPFTEAAERAADALTEAMVSLEHEILWPVALREVRLRAGSVFSGQALGQIPLRAETGVSVIAVSRAGRTHFDPDPSFALYPEDRLVLVGQEEGLDRAEALLGRLTEAPPADRAPEQQFAAAHVVVEEDSPWVGKTLAELNFRDTWGATVIGIERGEARLPAPAGEDRLLAGDHLIVAGHRSALQRLLPDTRGEEPESHA